MDHQHGVGSEVGRLRTVVLHRPGNELRRLTPRNNDDLLFDGVPWLVRAQQEHDQFAETLRAHDVEVLYLHELLTEVLDVPEARDQLLESALRPDLIAPALAPALRERGLLFVGIDVIDDLLTEINVTSPTGIRAIAKLGGPDVAAGDPVSARRHL